MARTRRYNADEDFDERGVLIDGRRVRFSMMDAANSRQRKKEDEDEDEGTSDGVRVTDAQGGTQGLHRPGFRFAANDARKTRRTDPKGREEGTFEEEEDDDTTRDAREAAYASYQADAENAWKGDAVGEGQVEGAICTVQNAEFPLDFGSPGHIRMFKGKLVCVPDEPRSAADHATNMDLLYRLRDQELANQWKKP